LRRMLVMLVATGGVLLAAAQFKQLECSVLLGVIAVVAWPIWRYQKDRTLFERRAILASVASPESWLRRFFWNGSIALFGQAFVAILWAALLLVVLAPPVPTEFAAILAIDTLLLALIIGPAERRLATQIQDGQIGIVAR